MCIRDREWNDADEFSRCIEAIEAIPEQERDYLHGLLVGHQRNLDLGLEYASLSLGMELSFAVPLLN